MEPKWEDNDMTEDREGFGGKAKSSSPVKVASDATGGQRDCPCVIYVSGISPNLTSISTWGRHPIRFEAGQRVTGF